MIKVEGMTCMHCQKRVLDALKALGLKKVNVDIETGIVTYKPSKKITDQQINETITNLGYRVL